MDLMTGLVASLLSAKGLGSSTSLARDDKRSRLNRRRINRGIRRVRSSRQETNMKIGRIKPLKVLEGKRRRRKGEKVVLLK